MRISREQYGSIIGLADRGTRSLPRDPGKDHLTLAEAARLARRGRYRGAENLLATLPHIGPLGSATLDLKARICAQQGRLLEAQLCWMEALRQSPGNPSYRRSLDCLDRHQNPSRLPLLVLVLVLAVLLPVCLVLLTSLAWTTR